MKQPKDVHKKNCHAKKDKNMCKHKVTGTKPENNTKADLVPIKLFYDTLAQVQDRANSLANPEYDDGCQAFLVYLEHFLYICERYPNTAAARIYKLKRKELYEIWNSWWKRNEKKIPVKYRSGIKESADSMFDRLFAIKSWAVSE